MRARMLSMTLLTGSCTSPRVHPRLVDTDWPDVAFWQFRPFLSVMLLQITSQADCPLSVCTASKFGWGVPES